MMGYTLELQLEPKYDSGLFYNWIIESSLHLRKNVRFCTSPWDL